MNVIKFKLALFILLILITVSCDVIETKKNNVALKEGTLRGVAEKNNLFKIGSVLGFSSLIKIHFPENQTSDEFFLNG